MPEVQWTGSIEHAATPRIVREFDAVHRCGAWPNRSRTIIWGGPEQLTYIPPGLAFRDTEPRKVHCGDIWRWYRRRRKMSSARLTCFRAWLLSPTSLAFTSGRRRRHLVRDEDVGILSPRSQQHRSDKDRLSSVAKNLFDPPIESYTPPCQNNINQKRT